jgi:hypothetical protein
MVRFICQQCGMKWFLPPNSPHPAPTSCQACDGPLHVLQEPEDQAADQRFGL